MVDGGVEALPQSYSGGAFAAPFGYGRGADARRRRRRGRRLHRAAPPAAPATTAPASSLLGQVQGGPANAILEPDPTWDCPEGFWAVPVEVGLSDNSKVEITRGLAEGQEVFIGYQNPDEMYY